MDHESLQGYAVKKIPFAHPSNLIGILAILRQQAAFNAIVTSCVRTTGVQGKFRNISLHGNYEYLLLLFAILF